MNIDLPSLLGRFRAFNDFENSVASYRTQVPWVGPEAYLNVIYRPAASHVLSEVGTKLQFPDPIFEFLGQYNGAKMFSGALNLYGVVEAGYLLNRQDSFSLPPFNIEEANRLWQTDPENLLVIGGYRFDGSRVCISRSSGQILLFRKKGREPELSWNYFESWLLEEITRLCSLFDDEGKRLWPESETVPRSVRRIE